jgi:hypothetical protein
LIEASLPAAAPVKRHGNEHVEALLTGKRAGQQISQWLRKGLDAIILEKMDLLPEHSLVFSVRVRPIEGVQAGGAQPAVARIIQRRIVQERSMAAHAKVFRKQRLGSIQASTADGDVGTGIEWVATNAAIVRKDEV